MSGILAFHIDPIFAIIIMGFSAMMTEAFVASNYAFAVIFITTQVIMLNGLASQNLNIEIAYTRIIDVLIGIAIAVIGIFILRVKLHPQCYLMLLPNWYVKKVFYFIIYFQK